MRVSLLAGVTVTIIVLIYVEQGLRGVGRLGNCTWKTVLTGMVVEIAISILRLITTALLETVLVPKMMMELMGMLLRLSNSMGRSMNM